MIVTSTLTYAGAGSAVEFALGVYAAGAATVTESPSGHAKLPPKARSNCGSIADGAAGDVLELVDDSVGVVAVVGRVVVGGVVVVVGGVLGCDEVVDGAVDLADTGVAGRALPETAVAHPVTPISVTSAAVSAPRGVAMVPP